MADDNVELYSLQIAADPASAQGAIAQINAVQAALAGVSTQAQALSAQMAAATQTLADTQILAADSTLGVTGALTTQATAVQDLTDLYAALDEQAKQAAQDELAANDAGAGGDGGGGGVGLTGSRRGIAALGGLVGAQAGGGAFTDAARFISLSAAFGEVGIAAGVLGLALHAVSASQQEATKTAQDYAAALGSIGTQTKPDIQKNIDDLTAQKTAFTEGRGILEGYQTKLDDLNKEYGNSLIGFNGINPALNDLNEEIYKATGGAYGLKDGIGNVVVNAGMLNGALDENQKSLDHVNAEIASNTTALNSQAVAANTAAALLKQYSDDQVKAAQRDIEINNMTKAQRDEKAKQDMADYDVLQKRIEAGGLTLDAATALSAQQDALLYDYRELTRTTNTYADSLAALAAVQASISTQTDNYLSELAQEDKTRDDITALNQQLTDADQEATDKSVALEADYQQKLAEIQQDGADKVAQINEDNSDKLAKIAQDNADRVAKIERDFARSSQDAIGNRNAYALQKAEQKRQDDLDDQAQANQRALDSQQQAYDKQIEAQEKAQDKQLRSLEDNYWKQQNAIDDAFNKQRDTILRKLQQDQVDLQNVLAAEQALALNGSGGLVQIHTDLWGRLIGLSEEYAHTLTGAVAAALNSNGGGNGGIGAPLGLPIYVEQPGNPALLPPVSGTGIGGAVRSITIQVHPTDGSAATNNFLRALDDMLPDNFRGGM